MFRKILKTETARIKAFELLNFDAFANYRTKSQMALIEKTYIIHPLCRDPITL
jgi:hypothetical protein